ncbi:MAG: hypothetical protein K0Q55_270 [Verrucomicrobia bacterium]|jgi:hypothetical protein|nr:hypothetical protein [Verrucomicrobiota bacterium]
MSPNNSKLVLPACAVASSFFAVAILRYSMGMFFAALGKQTDVLPNIVRFAWGIHDYRWLVLILGTVGLIVACRRSKTEAQANLISGFYMLGWFALCFFVQFCLIYGLNTR